MTNFNYLNSLQLSYQDLETSLKKMSLNFYSHKENYVENYNFEPHYFVYSFYDFVLKNKKVPTQKEFAEFYLSKNLNFFKKSFLNHNKLKKKYLLKNLIYRLYRAYPSFVRDLHFSIYLRDKLKNKDVYYNPYLDVMEGIDVLINDRYGIHLYTDTPRARYYRDKKHKRHKSNDKYIHIDIPINFRSCYKCGNFFLYREKEMKSLLKEINQCEKI